MKLKDYLFERLVREGYTERKDGRKVWDVANRAFLYLEDDMAKAFLNLRKHPRYKATVLNIETELLVCAAEKYVKYIADNHVNLIDLGCGDGKKARAFLEHLNGRGKLRFVPININKGLVDLAIENVKGGNFDNVDGYEPIVLDLNSLGKIITKLESEKSRKNVVLFLGSLLASFDIHEYLFELSNAMKKGDFILIGNAIRTGDRFSNIENYLHPLFLEWLKPLMRHIGFDKDDTEYKARFENGRVECYFEIKKVKTLSYKGKKYNFNKGDEIIGSVLYKYYADELEKFCKMYFREVELIKDSDEEQALICCIK